MAELRAWVLAKLLWDPHHDGEVLTNEFIEGYYGLAAHIKAYLKVTHDAVEAAGDWLGCFQETNAKFLSFDTLSRGWQHLRGGRAGGGGRSRPAATSRRPSCRPCTPS